MHVSCGLSCMLERELIYEHMSMWLLISCIMMRLCLDWSLFYSIHVVWMDILRSTCGPFKSWKWRPVVRATWFAAKVQLLWRVGRRWFNDIEILQHCVLSERCVCLRVIMRFKNVIRCDPLMTSLVRERMNYEFENVVQYVELSHDLGLHSHRVWGSRGPWMVDNHHG
jgi:hypothetical protein